MLVGATFDFYENAFIVSFKTKWPYIMVVNYNKGDEYYI
jgi:hypothetical protein